MFEQHPVPQQISSYQFRLVGDMTIKQFFQIAAGAIIALIIYGMPLPGFVKWPLIILAALGGAAFAFLPIQDRPLEQWLLAFFRSIYTPTLYTWAAQNPPPEYFKPEVNSQGTSTNQALQAQADITQSDVTDQLTEEIAPAYINNNQETNNNSQEQNSNVQDTNSNNQNVGIGVDSALQQQINDSLSGQIISEEKIESNQQSTEVSRPEIVVPQQQAVDVENKGVQIDNTVQPINQAPIQLQDTFGAVYSNTAQPVVNTVSASFSQDAAPPLPPTQANIIKGQVMDKDGHIIEGAILEIKDKDGRPVRALRSNKAGHFEIVTPIPDGEYNLIAEKDGFEFTQVSLITKGEIVPPIALRSN